MSDRPKCEVCGQETVRATTTAGKGRYQCRNSSCPNFMKKMYVRASD